MSSTPTRGPDVPSIAAGGPGRRSVLASGVFLAWTAFVWVGRIRNAVSDPDLVGADRLGPLLLALSFLVPAAVALVALVLAARAGRAPGATASVVLAGLAAWTTLVWVVRAGDIVLFGDHGAAFIAVHVLLAVISIGLAAWATIELGVVGRTVRSSVSAGPGTARHDSTDLR